MLKPLKSWPVAVAFVLTSASAVAQQETQAYPECTREPSDAAVKAAKGAFQAGQVSFEEGDYDRAMTYWADAYRRDCTAHALLLNLARVYELGGHKQQAVIALETYLEREPDTAKRDQIQRRIEVLREKVQAEQQPAQPPPQPTGTTPGVGPAPMPVQPQPPPEEDKTPSRPILPLFVAGAGGAIFLVSGIVYLGAASDVDDWETRCPDRQCPPQYDFDEANSDRTRQTVSGVIALLGVGMLGGGLVWYFTSPKEPREPAQRALLERSPQLSAAVGPGYTGLQLRGSF